MSDLSARPRRPRVPPPPPRKQAESVFQSDLAMNLFMVLMVVLATLAASAAAVNTAGYQLRMTSEQSEAQPPLGLIASWRPVLPVSPRLAIRDGVVHRLDMDKLAASFAASSGFLPIMNNSDIVACDSDPSSYTIALTLVKDPIPPAITAWRIAGAAFAADAQDTGPLASFEADLRQSVQFDVFIYPGQEALAWDVFARLHRAEKRSRPIFVERNLGTTGSDRPRDSPVGTQFSAWLGTAHD